MIGTQTRYPEAQRAVAHAVLAAHVKGSRIETRDIKLQSQDTVPAGIDTHVHVARPTVTSFGRRRRTQYAPGLVDWTFQCTVDFHHRLESAAQIFGTDDDLADLQRPDRSLMMRDQHAAVPEQQIGLTLSQRYPPWQVIENAVPYMRAHLEHSLAIAERKICQVAIEDQCAANDIAGNDRFIQPGN